MTDTSKTPKIIKRWYYSTAQWHLDDVMVSDITFYDFRCSVMIGSGVFGWLRVKFCIFP